MATVICSACKTPWMDWKSSACPKCGTPAPPNDVGVTVAATPLGSGAAVVDPEDGLLLKMVYTVAVSLKAMMHQYEVCFEQAEKVERAFGMANAEVVDGIPQHPMSKANFRKMAVSWEGELSVMLAELREKTKAAASQWKDLVFLLPGDGNDMVRLVEWCRAHKVREEEFQTFISDGLFIFTDYGLSRDSFWAENQRVIAVLNRSGK